MGDVGEAWPALPYRSWEETRQSLHTWSQLVGMTRMAHTPTVNEWWNVGLQPSARGLATGPIPHGNREFELELDLVGQALHVRTSDGETRSLALWARRACDFHREFTGVLASLDLPTRLWEVPYEVPDKVPFARDTRAGYDPAWARRFHRVIARSARVLEEFRAGFTGKASPVLFFWGTFDLALSLFTGRRLPADPGTGLIRRVSNDEEHFSVGFWPGSDPLFEPAYYAYAVPEPPGFREAILPVDGARYHEKLGEFVLPYERVRTSDSPEEELLAFARSAYAAAADLGRWDRRNLERPIDPLEGETAGVPLH